MDKTSTYIDILIGAIIASGIQRIANILSALPSGSDWSILVNTVVLDYIFWIAVFLLLILIIMRGHYAKNESIITKSKTNKLIRDTVWETIDEMGIEELIKDLPDKISGVIKQAYKDTHPQ